MKLVKRSPTNEEALSLHQAVRQSKHIISFPLEKWASSQDVYVAENEQGEMVGACIVSRTGPYYKLGPLAIVKKHQGKSFGKNVIGQIIEKYPQRSFVVGSSNPKVVSIANRFGFREVKYRQVFLSMRLYLLKYLLSVISFSYLMEGVEKNLLQKRGRYRVFVREGMVNKEGISK